MRRRVISLLVLPVLLAAAAVGARFIAPALGQDAPVVSAQGVATVSMVNNRFVPAQISVPAGSTITWVNEDYEAGEFHDAIAADFSFVSDTFAPGGAFSVTLDIPGVYEYYCDLHEGMFGTIFVE